MNEQAKPATLLILDYAGPKRLSWRWWLRTAMPNVLLLALAGTATRWVWQARHPWQPSVTIPDVLDSPNAPAFMACSPDGRRILTKGDTPDSLLIRDAYSGKVILRLAGTPPAAREARYSPAGRHIVSQSALGQSVCVCLWDPDSGRCLAVLDQAPELDEGFVRTSFSPCGRWVCVERPRQSGGDLRLWDTTTFRAAGGPFQAYHRAFTPDGQYIVCAGGGGIDDGSDSVRIYRCSDGTLVGRGPKCRSSLVGPVFELSPDGTLLATSPGSDHVQLSRVPSGELVGELRAEDVPDDGYAAMTSRFTLDGQSLLVLTTDDHIRKWDVRTRRCVGRCPQKTNLESTSITLLGDGHRAYVAAPFTGWTLIDLAAFEVLGAGTSGWPDFAPDGNRAMVDVPGGYRITDALLQRELGMLHDNRASRRWTWLPDGRIAEQSYQGDVVIWDRVRPEAWWGWLVMPRTWAAVAAWAVLAWSSRRTWRNARQ